MYTDLCIMYVYIYTHVYNVCTYRMMYNDVCIIIYIYNDVY